MLFFFPWLHCPQASWMICELSISFWNFFILKLDGATFGSLPHREVKRRAKRKAEKKERHNSRAWWKIFSSSLNWVWTRRHRVPIAVPSTVILQLQGNHFGMMHPHMRMAEWRGVKHLDDITEPLILLYLEPVLLLILKFSEIINLLIDKQA